MVLDPRIRAGIFAGESGGDYNALFDFSNRPGKPFSNVRLTDMTVDQALNFANPSGPYGQWVKGQIGRVATPMGGYQVVGTTLKAAKKGLGLSGNERMTEETQDRIGQWILQNQGTDAWEGYRGPRNPASVKPPPLADPAIADFVTNNPQPGGFGAEVENAVFGSMAPGGSGSDHLSGGGGAGMAGSGITKNMAAYYGGDEKDSIWDRLAGFGDALSKATPRDVPSVGRMGDARQSGNALRDVLNSPTMADALLKKRMPWLFNG